VEFAPKEGYLLLADISGYTSFLTASELDHAHAIVRELTTLIRRELAPPLRFVKLEGDAVYCFADTATFRDGERFLELVEACYVAFANRLDDMIRSTTCRCRACASIGSLGLKFVAHHGTFIVDEDDGHTDLAGRDVILVHRLLKNSIGEEGMTSGYAFFTHSCAARLPLGRDEPVHAETYDGLGTITGIVHDLGPVLAEIRASRSHRLTSEDADFETAAELPAAVAFVWQYLVDPVELQRWACVDFSTEPDVLTRNDAGRFGPGATSHCNHGPGGTWFREFLGWQPLESFTCRTVAPGPDAEASRSVVESFELVPVTGGTRVTIRVRVVDRTPELVDGFRQLASSLAAMWQRRFDALRGVIEADVVRQGETATP